MNVNSPALVCPTCGGGNLRIVFVDTYLSSGVESHVDGDTLHYQPAEASGVHVCSKGIIPEIPMRFNPGEVDCVVVGFLCVGCADDRTYYLCLDNPSGTIIATWLEKAHSYASH